MCKVCAVVVLCHAISQPTSFRFLQRCPFVFLNSAVAGTVSQCALAAATLNHRDAFSSVMKYLRDLICLPKDSAVDNFLCNVMMHLLKLLCRVRKNGP